MAAPPKQGAALFAEQLRATGYQVRVDGQWVEFDFEVPGGTYVGTMVQMAINVPPQFPTIPPGGSTSSRGSGRNIREVPIRSGLTAAADIPMASTGAGLTVLGTPSRRRVRAPTWRT